MPGTSLILDRRTHDSNSRNEYLGTELAVKAQGAEQAILNLFRPDNDWTTEAQMITCTDLNRNAVYRAVKKLLSEGLLEQRGEGSKAAPFEYRAAPPKVLL